jgi:hypothetical protein
MSKDTQQPPLFLEFLDNLDATPNVHPDGDERGVL